MTRSWPGAETYWTHEQERVEVQEADDELFAQEEQDRLNEYGPAVWPDGSFPQSSSEAK